MRSRPPIVVQCDPSRIAASAHPAEDAPTRGRPLVLPVGLVPWDEQQQRTTVVVKASYRYDRTVLRPRLQLMADQPGFTVAQASACVGAQAPEVSAPTDLVVVKARADVALVGFAFAKAAATQMPITFSIGEEFTREAQLLSADEVAAIPLTGEYLQPSNGEPAVPLGPVAQRALLPAHQQEDDSGLTDEEKLAQYEAALEALRSGEWKPFENVGIEVLPYDAEPQLQPGEAPPTPTLDTSAPLLTWQDLSRTVSLFEPAVQFSPERMACAFIEPDAVLGMRGLTPGGGVVALQLPGHQVLVVVEAEGHYDVSMVLDTLVVDTDAGVVSLTFRGQVPEDLFARSQVRLIVALTPLDAAPELADIYRELPRGHFSRAEVPIDVETLQVSGEDVELSTARQMTFHHTPDPLLSRDDEETRP